MKQIAMISLVGLAACNADSAPQWLNFDNASTPAEAAAAAAAEADTVPVATLDPTPPPPPPANATTVEQFDTTTEEDRAAALAPVETASETRLGTTLATLGSPADPGIWIETPLVSELVPGRAEVAETGASVNLELRPSGGEAGSGSEISLPAMRLLNVPLTAIQELVIYQLPAGAVEVAEVDPEG